MNKLRRSLSLSLSLALALLAPGLAPYHAAAQVIGAASGGASAAGSVGAAGASLNRGAAVTAVPSLLPSAMPVSPALSAFSAPSAVRLTPSAAPAAAAVAVQAAAPALAVSRAAAAKTAAAKTVAATEAAAPRTALEGLRLELPKMGEMTGAAAKETAGDDFLSRVGSFSAAKSAADLPAAGKELRANFTGSHLSAAKKDSGKGKGMPDSGDSYDGTGRPVEKGGDIDELGNPRRTGGEGGPDDRSDPDFGGGNGNSPLFGAFGLGAMAGTLGAVSAFALGPVMVFPMILISLVLHEIGHARMADRLGDPTSRFQRVTAFGRTKVYDRASLNPTQWVSHIDPVWTLLIPAVTFFLSGFIIGGARPVPVEPSNFKSPRKDMAKVALAGPMVNFGLAAAGALAAAAASAAGLAPALIAGLVSFVFLNAVLGLFNMIPLFPLDGSHILQAFLPSRLADRVESFYARMGNSLFIPMLLVMLVGGKFIAMGAQSLTQLLLAGAVGLVGLFGTLAPQGRPDASRARASNAPEGPAVPGPAAGGSASGPVDFVVMFGERRAATADAHITQVDVNMPNGVEQYARLQQAMLAQLSAAGLDSGTLEQYQASPLATYQRINAATIRVDGAKAADFERALKSQGYEVYPNERREIVKPIVIAPEEMDPSVRSAVTMDENLKIVKADSVHRVAEKMWGKPELGLLGRLWARVFKAEAPQPAIGVIDSGVDLNHPLLKRVKEAKNATSGENIDDIGHGSWVHSTVLHLAPWAKNTTHYKTFEGGGATLDDILKALTMAGNDGNLVISNSWGSDAGDPTSPDSKLVQKLAEEGHIMVFAAGNAGPGANTVGSPAIVHYKDATTGAIRVVSVAAADRAKRIARFSSRGPGSRKTRSDASYPKRPDLTAVGYNIEGAWPSALRDADREDAKYGPLKAISGTSMSTPGVAGAIALLAMMFGVTSMGPKLDAVVNAVMSTLEKTGQPRDHEGEGFLNVEAAYAKLKETIGGDAPAVTEYRRLSDRLYTLQQVKAMSGSWRYGSALPAEEIERINGEIASIQGRIAEMDAADGTLEFLAAGRVKRFFMRLFDRAPRA